MVEIRSEADQLLSGRTPRSADYDATGIKVCAEVTKRQPFGDSETMCAKLEDGQGTGAEEKRKERDSSGVCSAIKGWSTWERIMILAMAVCEAAGFASLSVIAPLFPPLVSESRATYPKCLGAEFGHMLNYDDQACPPTIPMAN